MSTKQAINDKLQSSVATCLRYGGVVNNQIKKVLLLSLWVENFLKSVNIWQSYQQERGYLMHFARLANTLPKTEKVHETITSDSKKILNRLRNDIIMVTSLS